MPPGGQAEPRAIGIDIGGTKIAGGVVTEAGQILDRTRVPTPPDEEAATLAAVLAAVDELLARDPGVDAIGVGAAGLVEWPGGRARWAPNNSYRRLELRRLLHERTGLPTSVDNDGNAAAWAEARFGAGAGCDDLVLVTVGTGIGGGLVLDGRLYHGEHGFAGELGHLIVAPDGDRCACGNRGCLEAMASGSTLGRLGREAAAAHPGSRLVALADRAGGLVTGEVVFAAASEGDKLALALFERVGHWLGVGIASLVTIFDPDLVVVGGGVAATGELLLGPARASFQRYVHGRGHRDLPPVVPTRLGGDAGLVGAATLALTRG
ncbi:MAG TPA: ROK family protein [Actinomycetota bacterium]|nr:ROK family protein [Actinomycetota bacterium]